MAPLVNANFAENMAACKVMKCVKMTNKNSNLSGMRMILPVLIRVYSRPFAGISRDENNWMGSL
jgi:hypothetical protein